MKIVKWITFLAVFFALLFCTPFDSSAGGFLNGNQLVQLMREYDGVQQGNTDANVYDAYKFGGYVIGVFDTTDGTFFIPPANVNIAQVCAIVANFLKHNPQKWNLPAANLVLEALRKAFPKE